MRCHIVHFDVLFRGTDTPIPIPIGVESLLSRIRICFVTKLLQMITIRFAA